ncbi:SPW repeat protein [Rhizobium mesosinicum]|uniref:SPW repeat protein n=1 Tax=Rhizobium mesosinicum TaxID=335017 RepID=A0ABS7GRK0_9HYPH|nr:SPW repeat protein [Rhizobium mesosinicum]
MIGVWLIVSPWFVGFSSARVVTCNAIATGIASASAGLASAANLQSPNSPSFD